MSYKPKILTLAEGGLGASITASNGQVFTSTASTAALTPSKQVGCWVWLDQKIASTNSTIALSGVSATYNNYVLMFSDMTFDGTISVGIQLNSGGGFINSGYTSGQNTNSYTSTTLANVTATSILMFGNAASTATMGGTFWLNNLTSGVGYPLCHGQMIKENAGASASLSQLMGSYNTPIVTTSIQIATSSGNVVTGTFTLYGIIS